MWHERWSRTNHSTRGGRCTTNAAASVCFPAPTHSSPACGTIRNDSPSTEECRAILRCCGEMPCGIGRDRAGMVDILRRPRVRTRLRHAATRRRSHHRRAVYAPGGSLGHQVARGRAPILPCRRHNSTAAFAKPACRLGTARSPFLSAPAFHLPVRRTSPGHPSPPSLCFALPV